MQAEEKRRELLKRRKDQNEQKIRDAQEAKRKEKVAHEIELENKRLGIIVLIYGFVISFPYTFTLAVDSTESFYDTPSTFKIDILHYDVRPIRTYFYFSYYLINDLFTLAANLAVDCLLVRRIRMNLKLKLARKWKNKVRENLTDHERTKFKEEEKKKASVERKATAMIIISVIIYLCCRLPELVGVFVLYNLPKMTQSSCIVNIFCYLSTNFIEYLYMLSYIFNIILYYKFSSYFRKGFRNFFHLSILPEHST